MVKKDIIAQLTALGVDFDPDASKSDLEALLTEHQEVETETETEVEVETESTVTNSDGTVKLVANRDTSLPDGTFVAKGTEVEVTPEYAERVKREATPHFDFA